MLFSILLVLALLFVGYAIITQYSKTPAEHGVPSRVWASLVAAAAAIGALIASWFHAGVTP